jgi:hypothetical protein
MNLKEVSINKGINIVEDFRHLPRSVDEGIAGIFRVGATEAGDEKTDEIETFIDRLLQIGVSLPFISFNSA